MRRPKKFLILILILLLINALYFIIWYPLGGRDAVRKLLTDKIGSLAKSELTLGDLHISDRQIFAQDISFATNDSLITIKGKSLRVRYNLYKLLFSGFKLDGVVSSVEILEPNIQINYVQKLKEDKPPKKHFQIPDLTPFFNKLSLKGGTLNANVSILLNIQQEGYLKIEENLRDIQISITNGTQTDLKLSASTSLGGELSVKGILDKGRIDLAEVDIEKFNPLYVAHPDIDNFRSEINLHASYSQPADSSEVHLAAEAKIISTSALLLDQYPLNISLITLEADNKNAKLGIHEAKALNSILKAELKIQGIAPYLRFDGSSTASAAKDLRLDGSSASLIVDLADIMPALSGRVYADLDASGSFQGPIIDLNAESQSLAYGTWSFDDLNLKAQYKDDIATVSAGALRWENQQIQLSAALQPRTREFSTELVTHSIEGEEGLLAASGRLTVDGVLIKPYPVLRANIYDFDLLLDSLSLNGINGYAMMSPADGSLLFDAILESDNGFRISAVGDILDQHISVDADFAELDIAKLYMQKQIYLLSPIVSGHLSAIMHDNEIWLKSNLNTALTGEYDYSGDLDILGSFDLKTKQITATLSSENGQLAGQPLDIDLSMDYQDQQLKVWYLKLEDFLNLSGNVNVADWHDLDFDLALINLDWQRLTDFYPDLRLKIPEFADLNLFAKYNREQDQKLQAWLNLQKADLISIVPLDLNLFLDGFLDDIAISGDVKSGTNLLLSLAGESSLKSDTRLSLQAVMHDLKMQDIMVNSLGEGSFSGWVEVTADSLLSKQPHIEFATDLLAESLKIGDFRVERAIVKARQQSQVLSIDSLYVKSRNLFEAHAQGALDYNLTQNQFFEGDKTLDIEVSGELFPWLKKLSNYVVESSGKSDLKLSIGTSDYQFKVYSGDLDIHDGYVLLKDQVEPMRNIEIKGIFDDNRFVIQKGEFDMGNGSFYMNNVFDEDPAEHFVLAFIDLGYLRLMIEKPGMQATIPVIAPPKTLTNIALKGINSRYATIRGPFDDMKIEAHATVSNLSILFPPGADNLLNLIMSVRGTGKKPDRDPVPLPFNLDLMVTIGENVRYVTYPTNFYLDPGGFFHLIYDGNRFIVEEANITSDRGSIDFFGTVFQVEQIGINMIDQQDILSLSGEFYKRTPDGSTITLSVTSSSDYDKSFFDRLQINLGSDNPSDQSIVQVLSRLRYDQNKDDMSDDKKQNLLQDEALDLIGGNLNASVLTPFFFPVENWIRRNLKLDGFSINAGFIQNIFTEYSSDPSHLAELTDINNFSSDIAQFSSAILLNNLSLSMSKYIGYRMFVDYKILLQEATDLQQKTKLLLSHEASLRLVLPKKYRLGYTLNYSPQEIGFSHEIMLQRTFRFWGL
ncbi:MAG: hypothetical protein RBQ87_01125 [Candidatus Cloacimonadaceae bacterium]|jgi:hypothetical protein|nr:hypothetical protein [Candidatus Cloacimonadaceae bacterium]